MKIEPFKLERYFAKHEFSAKYLLSSSDCDGFGLQYVLSCADGEERRLWEGLRLGYTESQGLPRLRGAIAAQYRTIQADDVLVLSPGEANYIFMQVALQPGDHVICMSPMYQSLYQVAVSLGCTISFWEPDPATWHYAPADLAKLVNSSTKALIINFPHNPTGALPTLAEVAQIVDFARTHQLLLFSDEMYHQLVVDPANQIPAFCDLYENALSLWGMAKTFGLAGLRIGWLATRNRTLLQKIMAYKDYITICNNAMSEILTLIALNHRDQFVAPNLAKIERNIGLFAEFQRLHPQLIDFTRPQAGSTAFIKLHLPGITSLEYSEQLVKATGIMLLPAEMFDYGQAHARIGFGRESLPEALSVWHEFIQQG